MSTEMICPLKTATLDRTKCSSMCNAIAMNESINGVCLWIECTSMCQHLRRSANEYEYNLNVVRAQVDDDDDDGILEMKMKFLNVAGRMYLGLEKSKGGAFGFVINLLILSPWKVRHHKCRKGGRWFGIFRFDFVGACYRHLGILIKTSNGVCVRERMM